jgi:hypothetical protein
MVSPVPSHVNWRMSRCTWRHLVLRFNEPGGDAAPGRGRLSEVGVPGSARHYGLCVNSRP